MDEFVIIDKLVILSDKLTVQNVLKLSWLLVFFILIKNSAVLVESIPKAISALLSSIMYFSLKLAWRKILGSQQTDIESITVTFSTNELKSDLFVRRFAIMREIANRLACKHIALVLPDDNALLKQRDLVAAKIRDLANGVHIRIICDEPFVKALGDLSTMNMSAIIRESRRLYD